MPKVSSRAQYELFKKWVETGRMSQREFNKRTAGVDVSKLPARAGKKKATTKRKATRKRTVKKAPAKKRTTKRRTTRKAPAKKRTTKRRKVKRRSVPKRKRR